MSTMADEPRGSRTPEYYGSNPGTRRMVGSWRGGVHGADIGCGGHFCSQSDVQTSQILLRGDDLAFAGSSLVSVRDLLLPIHNGKAL